MDEKLRSDLRQMFLDGATPSRLMEHVAKQVGDGPRLPSAIRECFREAFGIPLVRNVRGGEDYSPQPAHAHFNRDVLPEMVLRMGEWSRDYSEGNWLEQREIVPLDDRVDRLAAGRFEELDRVWGGLNERERLFIIRKIAQKDYLWDVVNVLAAVAERLQQKVVELEERLSRESGIAPRVK